MEKISVRRETFSRLHEYCHKGEMHDRLVNRLIDFCEGKKQSVINLSEETMQRLQDFIGSDDVDEAMNVLMDKCRMLKK